MILEALEKLKFAQHQIRLLYYANFFILGRLGLQAVFLRINKCEIA